MCGRFVLKSSADAIVEAFGINELLCDVKPNYNVAPTQQVYVVLQENESRLLTSMRWGLIPAWAKDISFGNKTINARAETAAQKPSFRSAFHHRRCLVIADGYYEWRREGKRRIPMYIHAPDEQLLAFAGLWERWSPTDLNAEDIDTCTILTTEANEPLASIHDRMPVLLDDEDQPTWLNNQRCDLPQLQSLLRPAPAQALRAFEVSAKVNNVRTNTPECIEPAEEDAPPAQGSLFDL